MEQQEVSNDDISNGLPMPQLAGHLWKQYGNMIECTSCVNKHKSFLKPQTYISGYKDGIPVISKL